MWFSLALASAVIYSFRSLLEKKYLKSIDPYILALAVRAFALPLFVLPFVLGFVEFPVISEIPSRFWLAVIFISFVSTPLETIFLYKALQVEEVSYVIPLLGLAPMLTVIINAIIFQELPSVGGILGMLIIVLGLYTLNVQKQNEHFLEPWKHLINNMAFRYISLMLISYSVGIVIDKLAITASSVYFYSLINYLFVSTALFIIAMFKARKQFSQLKRNVVPFSLIGLVVAGYTWLRFTALEIGNAGYVSATLSTNVIFTIVLGLIFFKEKNASRKIAVGLTMLIGLAMIKIYG